MYSERETALFERYAASYGNFDETILRQIERTVCGCDLGASSWATRKEADAMIPGLGLRPGVRLLDIGAGSGWPGLYLAEQSGCHVALVDVPEAGLDIARRSATGMGISDHVDIRAADAASTGYPDAFFDVVTHSDVLCCLPHKDKVLAECRRLVSHEGVMQFSVIYVPEGLSAERHAEGVAAGPEFVDDDLCYPGLLSDAGWTIVEARDVTGAFCISYEDQLAADLAHVEAVSEIIGTKEAQSRIAMWQRKIRAIHAGVLKRAIYQARPTV